MNKEEGSGLYVAIAIVVAGLAVASAVIFTGGNKENTTEKDPFISMAVSQGVSESDLKKCQEDQSFVDKVKADSQNANEMGVQGTPFSYIFVKDKEPGALSGALPVEFFAEAINQIKNPETVANLSATSTSTTSSDPDIEFKKKVRDLIDQNKKAYNLSKIRPADFSKDHYYGNQNAEVVIIEYSDLQCPYCSKAHVILKKIVDDSNGQIVWIYRHLPLVSLHPNAFAAAHTSECVASIAGNDAFWKFIEYLLANPVK
jgi:protein-disulfide isomerase